MKKRSEKQQKMDLVMETISHYYEEYLLESEDRQISHIREDAFFAGCCYGMDFFNKIQMLEKENLNLKPDICQETKEIL
jgi:hypothetical protein